MVVLAVEAVAADQLVTASVAQEYFIFSIRMELL
jgi:hypothetical protein